MELELHILCKTLFKKTDFIFWFSASKMIKISSKILDTQKKFFLAGP